MRNFTKSDIIITSYPGPPERRESRIGMHVKQRQRLAELFPRLKITSLCSGYSKKERKRLEDFDCVFLEERTHKYLKHNMVLEQLYNVDGSKGILFLDDDVVPAFFDDLPTDPVKFIEKMLRKPNAIPAPCMFFSCHGIFADMHRSKRTIDFIHAPMKIVGWAMFARNDLEVVYCDRDMYYPPTRLLLADDFAFRCRCAIEGKLVLKHQRLYFESFQKTPKHSSLFVDQDQRKEQITIQDEYLCEQFPHIFKLTTNKLGKRRVVPVWNSKGREELYRKGGLTKTPYGYLPVTEVLRTLMVKRKRKGFGL